MEEWRGVEEMKVLFGKRLEWMEWKLREEGGIGCWEEYEVFRRCLNWITRMGCG